MADVPSILEARLPPGPLRALRSAGELAARQNVPLFLVGGAVRDILLGPRAGEPDLDVVGVGADAAFASRLAEHLDGELLGGSQFGTWKIALEPAHLDLVSARRESYDRPGALPTVEPGSIGDDLARRDFSINAMALSLGPSTWGELLDPFDGGGDLDRRLIRALHPASFSDDGTRMLRAARYARRLGFDLEPGTRRLAAEGLGHLGAISGDRIRRELGHILHEDRAACILELCDELGILSAIHPPLRLEDRTAEAMRALDAGMADEREPALLALLAYSLTSAEGRALTRRLNLGVEWSRAVRDTGEVRGMLPRLAAPDMRPSQLYALLRRLHPASIRAGAMLADDRAAAERLGSYLNELRGAATILRGGDLIELGVAEGPRIGELLREILDARLNGLIAAREEEVQLVLRRLEQGLGEDAG